MPFTRSPLLASFAAATSLLAAGAAAQDTTFIHLEDAPLEDVWVRADADFARFQAVYVAPIDVAYKEVDPQVTLDNDTLAAVNAAFRQELQAALGGPDGYAPASASGPGVLSILIALRDVVVPAHTWAEDAGSVAFMSEGGEMTMALVLRDGETGANLATATDRLREEDVSTGVSTAATRDAAGQTAIAAWSRRLRETIDATVVSAQ